LSRGDPTNLRVRPEVDPRRGSRLRLIAGLVLVSAAVVGLAPAAAARAKPPRRLPPPAIVAEATVPSVAVMVPELRTPGATSAR